MTAQVTMHAVAKGDHSLAVAGRRRDEVLDEVLVVAAEWMRTLDVRPRTEDRGPRTEDHGS